MVKVLMLVDVGLVIVTIKEGGFLHRILYVVNNIDYFISHRLVLAQAALNEGYQVWVASPAQHGQDKLAEYGLRHVYLPMSRSGISPYREWVTLWSLWRIYRQVKPEMVHHITIKPVIYGGLVARLFPKVRVISAITGMGYVFSGDDWRRRSLRFLVGRLYRLVFKHGQHQVIFQNSDDRGYFIDQGWINTVQSQLILGAGVCPQHYKVLSEPSDSPVVVVLPARLLWDKGVGEFVEAARWLKEHCSVRCVLVGDIDAGNPASLTHNHIQTWVDEGLVEWWGWCDDMLAVFQQCHLVCLPSYREGLPRVLIEAASCGRAIVTTDVPGCREIVKHKDNGLLVPARDSGALAEAIYHMVMQTESRLTMAQNGRSKVEQQFTEHRVCKQTLEVYAKMH